MNITDQLNIPSPETEQCIFCKMVSGSVPCRKIYEDEKTIAILDINPANPGHVLVIPKQHYSIMPMIPEADIGHHFNVAKKISSVVLRVLKAESTNIFVANGAAAGQKAPHFMIHVIPRRENDGITCFEMPKNEIKIEDQEKLQNVIGGTLQQKMGIVPKEPIPETNTEEPLLEQEEEVETFEIPPPEVKKEM